MSFGAVRVGEAWLPRVPLCPWEGLCGDREEGWGGGEGEEVGGEG